MQFIRIFFISIFLSAINPIFGSLIPFSYLEFTFRELTSGWYRNYSDEDSIGNDAVFFRNAFTQTFSNPNTGRREEEDLSDIYDSITSYTYPFSLIQNWIQLNNNGKVLYRVIKDDMSLLYVYDSHLEKIVEIIKEGRDSERLPYRLNNKDQILYFTPHFEEGHTLNIRSKGKDRIILDPNKMKKSLGRDFDDVYFDIGRIFDQGIFSPVEFNDLGQVLLSCGDEFHHTLFIDSKKITTQFMDLPYHVLGMNQKGDIFIDYESDDNSGYMDFFGIYHSQSKRLTSISAKYPHTDYVIYNTRGDVVFPTLGEPEVRDSDREYLRMESTLFCSKEGLIEAIPTLGGMAIYPRQLNDHGKLVGFGLNAKKHINAFIWDKKNKTQNLGTLGGERSVALSINNKGEVVGFAETKEGKFHAFITKNKKMVDIGKNFNGNSLAVAINELGWVAGIYQDELERFRGFLYHETKGTFDIGQGLPDHHEISYYVPIGFNQRGEVLGFFFYGKIDEEGYHYIEKFPFIFNPEKGRALPLPNWSQDY